MFEIYAVIASLLLPTGLISLVHLLWNIPKKKPVILWTLILECIVTILLGIFYTCCAIILSRTSVASEDTHLVVNNNVDDLAIINDTFYTDFQSATFYNKLDPTRLDETNEVEDSRNNKEKADPIKFLKNYQHLIQTEFDRQRLQNGTNQEGAPYQRMRYSARHNNMEQPHKMDTLENSGCFLRVFFYRALLVYSFVTCAISLLNTCHLSQQYFINGKPSATEETKTDNPSEQFGEKILDNISDNSSQNAVPVGPLFDEDSLHKTTPNLDVFNVKTTIQEEMTESSCSRQTLEIKREGNIFIVVTCAIMLTLPAIFVAILYMLMRSGYTSNLAPPDKVTFDLLSTFNITSSDTDTVVVDLVKTFLTDENNINGTYQKDMESVLRRVYDVINKFKDEHNQSTNILPTIRGQYLLYPSNCTDDYLGIDKTNLKTFDFIVFVVLFFAVILYSKLSETNMSTTTSTRILNKYKLAFAILWAPKILDMVVTMFITNREPHVISSLLLLIGNFNRLYSSIQNFCSLKRYVNSTSGSIKPAS